MGRQEMKSAPFGDDATVFEDGSICRQGRIVCQNKDSRTGYWVVAIVVGGKFKTMLAHRVVCMALHGPPAGDKKYVRHIDGNQDNNHASNLCWGTHSENMADRDAHGKTCRGERQARSKLTTSKVLSLRQDIASGMTTIEAARKYGISQMQSSHIATGRAWKSVGGPRTRRGRFGDQARLAQSAMKRWEER